jgi:hypothetical protein
MHNNIVERVPLLLSLFRPRWHFDGPAVLKDHWVMTWALDQEAVPGPSLVDHYAGDRYAARGVQMVEESALAVFNKLKSLPPGMAEAFANSFATGSNRLRTTGENTEESARVPDDFTSTAGKRDFSSIQRRKATSYDRVRNCRRKREGFLAEEGRA